MNGIMSLSPNRGRTHWFWCGSHQRWCLDQRGCRRLCSLVLVHYLFNQWMDFDQTGIDTLLGWQKELTDFDDLDLILKVTPAL